MVVLSGSMWNSASTGVPNLSVITVCLIAPIRSVTVTDAKGVVEYVINRHPTIVRTTNYLLNIIIMVPVQIISVFITIAKSPANMLVRMVYVPIAIKTVQIRFVVLMDVGVFAECAMNCNSAMRWVYVSVFTRYAMVYAVKRTKFVLIVAVVYLIVLVRNVVLISVEVVVVPVSHYPSASRESVSNFKNA